MNNDQQPRRRRGRMKIDPIELLASADTTHDSQREYLAATYPDVDEEYRPKWQVSDLARRDCDEHTAQMEYAADALEKAADACRKLASQTGTGSPRKVKAAADTLLHAIHKTEEIVIGLKYSYPQPRSNFYEMASQIPEIANTVPKLLFVSDTEFVFWMPYLPSYTKSQTSIIMREAADLLYNAQLPRLKKWHCDFIHCYPPDVLRGVLDPDNYHNKPILDVIARAMHAKDSRDNFSISLHNLPTTDIPRGFYLHVYAQNEKVQFLADFVRRIQALNED